MPLPTILDCTTLSGGALDNALKPPWKTNKFDWQESMAARPYTAVTVYEIINQFSQGLYNFQKENNDTQQWKI